MATRWFGTTNSDAQLVRYQQSVNAPSDVKPSIVPFLSANTPIIRLKELPVVDSDSRPAAPPGGVHSYHTDLAVSVNVMGSSRSWVARWVLPTIVMDVPFSTVRPSKLSLAGAVTSSRSKVTRPA